MGSEMCIRDSLTLEQRYTEQAVNICSGTQTSLLELVDMIKQELFLQNQLSEQVSPSLSQPLPGDIQHSLGSPSLLQTLVNWHPKNTLQLGIKNIIIASLEERP